MSDSDDQRRDLSPETMSIAAHHAAQATSPEVTGRDERDKISSPVNAKIDIKNTQTASVISNQRGGHGLPGWLWMISLVELLFWALILFCSLLCLSHSLQNGNALGNRNEMAYVAAVKTAIHNGNPLIWFQFIMLACLNMSAASASYWLFK